MHRTVGWLDENARRRYPFVDDVSLAYSANGETIGHLSNNVLLDLSVSALSPAATGAPFTLVSFEAASTHVTFTFSASGAAFEVVVPVNAAWPFVARGKLRPTVQVATYEPAGLVAYCATFGEGVEALHGTNGVYTLDGRPALRPCLLARNPLWLNSLRGIDAENTLLVTGGKERIANEIQIDPGYNCNALVTPGRIHIQFGKGRGAGQYCVKQSAKSACDDVFLRFNGATANADGEFKITGGTGVSVGYGGAHTIIIKATDAFRRMTCSDLGGTNAT